MARLPVVFVPGFPASGLRDGSGTLFPPSIGQVLLPAERAKWLAALRGADDPADLRGIVPEEPIRFGARIFGIAIGRQAEILYDVLEDMGYVRGADLRGVGWDWRLPVDHSQTQSAVRDAIHALHATHGPVALLVHSTGGLVTRALLEAEPALAAKVAHLIGIGVPWAGTLKSLRYVSMGEAFGPVTEADMRDLIGHAHAAFDLMPPDPATSPEAFLGIATRNGKPSSPLVATGWLDGRPGLLPRAVAANARLGRRKRRLAVDVPVTLLAGWGLETDTSCRLEDTKVTFDAPTEEGDGTVPTLSAMWLDAARIQRFLIPAGWYDASHDGAHAALFESPPVVRVLRRILVDQQAVRTHLHAAFDTHAIASRAKTAKVRLVACHTSGLPLAGVAASFEASAHQAPAGAQFDSSGRGSLLWQRIPGHQGAAIPCALTFRWNEGGTAKRRTFEFLIPN